MSFDLLVWCFLWLNSDCAGNENVIEVMLCLTPVHPIGNSSLMLTLPVIEDKLVFLNKLKVYLWLKVLLGLRPAFCSSFHSYLSLTIYRGPWAVGLSRFHLKFHPSDLKGVSHGGDREAGGWGHDFPSAQLETNLKSQHPLVTFDGCVRP